MSTSPLHVHTARIGCRDADALDITRKSGGDLGLPFAPSWAILRPALHAREQAKLARDAGHADEAALVEAAAWEIYVPAFTEEMRRSYIEHRGAWQRLLARPRVVLCCYCAEDHGVLRCHRRVLADLLVKCGAVNMGELPRAVKRTR